jgi:hypothetical protein
LIMEAPKSRSLLDPTSGSGIVLICCLAGAALFALFRSSTDSSDQGPPPPLPAAAAAEAPTATAAPTLAAPTAASLDQQAEALANAGAIADEARAQMKNDLTNRKRLFAPPTAATCTKADGEKILRGIAELRADAARCQQQPAISLDPGCMQLLSRSFAHVDWVTKQVDTLPIPPSPPGSLDRALDTNSVVDDIKDCCSCDVEAKKSCGPVIASLDASARKIREWEQRIDAKDDDECIMSDLQRPMMH